MAHPAQDPTSGSVLSFSTPNEDTRQAWLSVVKQRMLRVGHVDARAPEVEVQSVRGILAQEVDGILYALLHVFRQQNALLPVSRLPAELLARVFVEVREQARAGDIEKRGSPSLGWLNCSQVCHGWRSIATECVNLWVEIPLNFGEEAARVFLARCKELPVSVRSFGGFIDDTWQHELLGEQIHRIESLDLIEGVIDVALCFQLLQLRTPERLKKLTLVSHRFRYTLEHEENEALAQARQLQHVDLDNISFSLEILPWAQLRTLKIHSSSIYTHTFPPVDFVVLVSSLASASALEELHLGDLAFLEETVSSSPVVINLPRLRSFIFGGYATDFEHLSRLLQMPSTASLHLGISPDSRGDAKADLVSTLLRTHTGPEHCIQQLQLSAISRMVHLEAWQQIHIIDDGPGSSDAFISVIITLPAPPQYAEALEIFCRNVGLSELRQLHLDFFDECEDDIWDKDKWHELFSSARKVESVRIKGRYVRRFFEAIAHSPLDTDSANSQLYSLFPLLSEVCLSSYEAILSDHQKMDLPAWFQARAQHAPIAVLRITGYPSKFDMEVIKELRNVDGLEMVGDDDTCGECFGIGCEECPTYDDEDEDEDKDGDDDSSEQ